jgi:hypothetical protein
MHASNELNDITSAVATKRFNDIIAPFVGAHGGEMRHLLHIATTLITGSCATQMLMGSDKSPKNLNLITPFECADVLYAYIVSDLQYAHVDTDATPHRAFGDSLNSFVIFQKGDLNITVSEATPDGIFNVITSSPTTADMTIMTPGGLAVFYPHWTMRKIALESHRMRRANFDSEEQVFVGPSVGCAGKSIFSVERTTNFLEEACRARCPSLWRNIADEGEQILVIKWDERYSMKALVRRSETMWCLALYCQNRFCCYNPDNNA